MANPRQQKIVTATILAIGAIGVAMWLMGQSARESAPVAPSPAVDPTGAPIAAAAGGTAREPASRGPINAPGARHDDVPAAATQTATLEIHVHFVDGAGADEERLVALRAVAEHSNRVVGESRCRGHGDEAIGYLEVPSNQWNHIEAVVDGAHVPGRRLHLGPGERYRIDLECGAHRTRLHVVGPSTQLAPHLRIEVRDHGAEPVVPFALPLDAESSVACYLLGNASAKVVLSGGARRRLPLCTRAGQSEFDSAAADIDLLPTEPLLGIVTLSRQQPVAAAIALGANRLANVPVPCNVTTQATVGGVGSIEVMTATEGQFRGPIDRVRQVGDLWHVNIESLDCLGELRVTFAIEELTARAARLVAVPVQGGNAVPVGATKDAKVKLAQLPAGDYRLAWAPYGVADEPAVEFVRIVAGERSEVEVAPRLLETWTVSVIGAPKDLPIALGQGDLFLGHGTGGNLTAELARPPRVGETAWVMLKQEKAAFDAEFVAVDTSTRRATLKSTLAHAKPIRLLAVPLRDNGRTRISLLPTPEHPVAGGWFFQSQHLHLLPGQKRYGYVTETVGDQEQLTRWFEVSGDSDEVVLPPAGRWTTLTLPRPMPRVRVFCENEHGPARLRFRAPERSMPFYVAEGTTAVHVEVDGVVQTFDPRLIEFVVR